MFFFFFSSRRRHTRFDCDWSSDVCSSDLKADLAASTKRCTLAYMHHPLFSSGTMADTTERPLWQDLYAAGADVVVAGHDHNYQRFAPQTPTGVADPISGIREFVAGWGGGGRFSPPGAPPHSQPAQDPDP